MTDRDEKILRTIERKVNDALNKEHGDLGFTEKAVYREIKEWLSEVYDDVRRIIEEKS